MASMDSQPLCARKILLSVEVGVKRNQKQHLQKAVWDTGMSKEYPPASGVAANRTATSSKAQNYKHRQCSIGKALLKTTKWLTSRKQLKIKMAKTHGFVIEAYVVTDYSCTVCKRKRPPCGRLWPVSLSHWGTRTKVIDNRLAIKTKGWYKFCESNNLKDGDVCLFKLKRMSRSISTAFMDVKITRHRS